MHYYTFNIGDYTSHTAHLEPLEDLAYRRMLDWCYLHESPLPDSIEQIAKLVRMRTHCDCIANVLQEYFTKTEYGWEQSRIMRDIEEYHSKSEKASKAAKARWAQKPKESNANALQTHSERNANQEPITNNHKPKRGSSLPPDWVAPVDYWNFGGMEGLTEAQILVELRKFHDYYLSKGETRKDWLATWRNWVRRIDKDKLPKPTAVQQATDKSWREGL